MDIQLKRIYEPAATTDGYRILVERLWPRGVSKEKAKIDWWLKDVSPSHELRKWFGHDPEKWPEFKKRYYEELAAANEAVTELLTKIKDGKVSFLFSSRETNYNNAVALKEYLEALI